MDNFDTLITKAALHGSKLLKKSHQATAVGLASHLWWQEPTALVADRKEEEEEETEGAEGPLLTKSKIVEKLQQLSVSAEKDEDAGVKAVSILIHQCVNN